MAKITISNVNEFVDLFTGKYNTDSEGTTSNPWEIDLLANINMNDISDDDEERSPYKTNFLPKNIYINYFNGHNHTISNISYSGAERFVLFRYHKGTLTNSIIKNIIVKDIHLNLTPSGGTANTASGVVIPYTSKDSVQAANIQVTGNITRNAGYAFIFQAGGTGGTTPFIKYCSFKGIISNPIDVGFNMMTIFNGVYYCPINNCFFEGKITGEGVYPPPSSEKSIPYIMTGQSYTNCYAKDSGGSYPFKFSNNSNSCIESYIVYSDSLVQKIQEGGVASFNSTDTLQNPTSKTLLVVSDKFDELGITITGGYPATSEQLKSAEWLREQGWAI